MPSRKCSTESVPVSLTLHQTPMDESDLWFRALESVLFPTRAQLQAKPRNTLLRA